MKSFKKVRFIMVAAFIAAIGIPAFAGTTDTLVLTGYVPQILNISVAPDAIASNLDLSITVATVKIATVTELSNRRGGYHVSLSSANAAANATATPFFKSVSTADTLNYSLTYGGTGVTFNASGVATPVSAAAGKTTAVGTPRDLSISYLGAASFLDDATNYTDTLTFTIIAP